MNFVGLEEFVTPKKTIVITAPPELPPLRKKKYTRNYKVQFDSREHGLDTWIDALYSLQIETFVEPLATGDILIFRDNKPYVLLERITLSDFVASLLDKRLLQQNWRLQQLTQDIPICGY